MIITKTPYRISFFGGGTDYPEHYTRHGGAVLGAAIDHYCWLAVRPPTRFGPRFRVICSRVEECDRLDDVRHPAVREILRLLEVPGAEVHHWGDLPPRSGVGSSSAFVVGLLHALHAMKGQTCKPCQLAEEAVRLERDVLRETVGCQDQYLTACGGVNLIEFPRSGRPTVASLGLAAEIDPVPVHHLRNRLLLFYTGIQRTASDVAAGYVKDFPRNESTLFRLRKKVYDARDALEAGDLDGVGYLLHDAWELKKSLGSGVSTLGVDVLYEKARDAGALGGKLLGAGGGGMLLLYAPLEKQPAVRLALKNLIEVPFKFEDAGSRVVREGGGRDD